MILFLVLRTVLASGMLYHQTRRRQSENEGSTSTAPTLDRSMSLLSGRSDQTYDIPEEPPSSIPRASVARTQNQ